MTCDKCKKEMVYFHEGHTCGWRCDECNNSVVTTYIDPIRDDDNIYTIKIMATSDTKANNVKCVAKACNCSFVEAKIILTSGKEIGGLDAVSTRDILRLLKPSTIDYSVSPEFSYDI
ncbi:MAG: hypothetical protein K6G69_10300 [Lachnospiraceae bacterium]|nr:hypothetical protein [Lachnospiraceae bacterium]